MPHYLVEREIPGAGKWTKDELRAASQKSREVLDGLGTKIQWLRSYIANDKVYCLYITSDPELIREHSRRSGFPANRIEEVRSLIDPATAEP
jgi:hypothetical protein